MAFKIGFAAEQSQKKTGNTYALPRTAVAPRKSVVQVLFPERGTKLAYYNDRFDLHPGDIVFVEGKLEGLRGRVTDVNYNFKIKLSYYKRVIAVADTEVHGQFHMAGFHFVTFDPNALPVQKARGWFLAPAKDDEEYASGSDSSCFQLSDLKGLKVSEAIAERGCNYYRENKVVYICINGTGGYAIVEGSEPYEVEFSYYDGDICDLVCSCFCSCSCKHQVAAMLQLRETLELIEKNYRSQYEENNYFAAVSKSVLLSIALEGKDNGGIVL